MFNLEEKNKRIAEHLEDHLHVWKSKNDFSSKYQNVVDYVQDVLKLKMSTDSILRIISSSYTNDFSHNLPNGNQVE